MSTITDLSVVVATLRATVATILAEQVPSVTVIDGHPINLLPGSLPAICLDMVTMERREPGEPDSQLGSWDWHITLPLSVYVAANEDYLNPSVGSALAEKLAANTIIALDADPQLDENGGSDLYSIIEAVIPTAEPFVGALNQSQEPIVGFDLQLHVFLLLPQTTL